jgi:hypothetical protein
MNWKLCQMRQSKQKPTVPHVYQWKPPMRPKEALEVVKHIYETYSPDFVHASK